MDVLPADLESGLALSIDFGRVERYDERDGLFGRNRHIVRLAPLVQGVDGGLGGLGRLCPRRIGSRGDEVIGA